MEKNDSELTPLERYLAKQKQNESIVGDSVPHKISCSAAAPELTSEPVASGAESLKPMTGPVVAGDFGPRFFAFFLDSIFVWAVSIPFHFVTTLFVWFLPGVSSETSVGSQSLSKFLAIQFVTFFYYGYFYSVRGASPGKILFGLSVIKAGTGQRLSYIRSYLRESVGKYISALIWFFGYFVALINREHKALHDMILDTRVIKQNIKQNKISAVPSN